jgi:hypothetical protein
MMVPESPALRRHIYLALDRYLAQMRHDGCEPPAEIMAIYRQLDPKRDAERASRQRELSRASSARWRASKKAERQSGESSQVA